MRKTNAARLAAARPAPAAPNAPVADFSAVEREPRAANDAAPPSTGGRAVPRYVVTPELRALFVREAMALDAGAVPPLPKEVDERLTWMEGLQGAAWRDQAELAAVDTDGEPITREEIDRWGERIEWVRGVVAEGKRPAHPTPAGDALARTSTERLRAGIEADQKTLHRAMMYRFRDDPARRKPLRDARRARSKATLSARSTALLAAAGEAGMEAWLRRLPRGEGAALDRLRAAHPEWVRRVKGGDADDANDAATLAARAFATLRPTHERVVAAGRYLTEGRPERQGDYAGYRPPARRKRAKPAPAPQPPTG